ncbi:baseplate J/gp47 family protein [Gluconacetobacter entanii]|nr:baseplate J/gp47 family protein [Gluconacetobacter entanii]MCW4592561.1 baseplate J/gp47 family protein [Gluconacetobacter entanii]NPC90264.1 baseplate J/gp47 family protein [Gluconacetobacter entanii]
MPASIPTPAQLSQRFAAYLLGQTFTAADGTQVTLDANAPGSLEQVLAIAHGLSDAELYRYLRDALLEMMPDTATIDGWLPRLGSMWGVPRKSATAGIGNVVFTCSQAVVIPAQTLLTVDGSVQWTTTAEASIAAGASGSVAVQATSTGTTGNVGGNVTLTLVSPIAGVTSAVTDAQGIAGGAAIEDQQSWRNRIVDRIRNPPAGGNQNDYETWATNAGATYVNPVRGWVGVGTVGVIVAMAGPTAPTDAEVAAIQTYIDDPSRRPVRANAVVVAAQVVPQDITLSITPDTDANRDAVQEAVDTYYASTKIGAKLLVSGLDAAIGAIPSLTSYLLTAPTANVQLAANQIAASGTITWQAAS